MKIVCQSCGAKYAIADEKVKGKVFKIRCKKCNEAIVVKGTEDSTGPAGASVLPDMEEENEIATKVVDYANPPGGKGDPLSIWHLVVEGEQRGPFTLEQLRHFQEAGTVTHETYVWREGFAEWKPIREVPDLGGNAPTRGPSAAAEELFAAEPAPASGGGLFDSPASAGGGLFDAGGGLFGGGGSSKPNSPFAAEGGLFGGNTPAAKQGDVFSSTGSGGSKEDLFGALESPAHMLGDEHAMTGARNESSVLFSLSNLQALASSPQAGMATSGPAVGSSPYGSGNEASGLIDIRALAGALNDSSKKDSSLDDIMSFGGGGYAAPLGAPILMATRGGGMSTSLKIGLIAGAVLFIVVAVVATVVMVNKSKEESSQVALLLAKIEQMEQSGASEEEKAKAREELASAQSGKTGQPEAAATEPADAKSKGGDADAKNAKPTKADAEKDRAATARKSGGDGGKPVRSESSPSNSGAAAAAAPSAPVSKGKASSELDELLGGGSAPAKKPAASKPAATAPASSSGGGEVLSREQVQNGLNAVAPGVKRCGQGQTGTITIQVVISAAGRVAKATPTGSFAGTPIGACAARAVQSARFPKSSKDLTVRYPFKL